MTRLLEGIKILYTGKNSISRQICLFSVCGIIGLANAYLALGMQNINEITLLQKIVIGILNLLFGLFFIGYEIKFFKIRELPDITTEIVKIGLKKVPFITFLISVPVILLSLFSKFHYLSFCLDTLIAIPIGMLLAGFSYNYNEKESLLLFKKFRVKEYFILLLERIWIAIMSYMVTFLGLFITFLIVGIIIATLNKGDITTVSFLLSSKQIMLVKFINYISVIILTYILAISVLAWDYELITMSEQKD